MLRALFIITCCACAAALSESAGTVREKDLCHCWAWPVQSELSCPKPWLIRVQSVACDVRVQSVACLCCCRCYCVTSRRLRTLRVCSAAGSRWWRTLQVCSHPCTNVCCAVLAMLLLLRVWRSGLQDNFTPYEMLGKKHDVCVRCAVCVCCFCRRLA